MGTYRVIVLQAFLVLCLAGALFRTAESQSMTGAKAASFYLKRRGARMSTTGSVTSLNPKEQAYYNEFVTKGVCTPTFGRPLFQNGPTFVSFNGDCVYDATTDANATFCDSCWAALDPSTTTYTELVPDIWGAAAENFYDSTLYCDLYYYTSNYQPASPAPSRGAPC